MITSTLNNDGFTGNILIEPNRPLSWSENVRFIKIFAIVSFIIAMTFMYHGFLLVLPYSGLEVLALGASLYLVYKHYTTCEVIYFTNDSVIIEFGNKHAENKISYQRYWSKFHIDNTGRHNIPRLTISSKGNTTEIGSFLSYSDKLKLINIIKELTSKFQSFSS